MPNNKHRGEALQKLNIAIPQDAVWILNKLNEGGHEAYIVGGCVRDSILGRMPQDWDITTSALPEETKTIFDHTFDTGIKHGTITVVLHHENYEVTTYRIDGEYADCRHPDEVSFTKKLNEERTQLAGEVAEYRERLSAVQEDVKILRDVRHWLNQVLPSEQYRQTAEPGKKPSIQQAVKGRAQRIQEEQAEKRQQPRTEKKQDMEL